MANDDKTIEERLSPGDKVAVEKAAKKKADLAKRKIAKDKAEADRKKREQERAKTAEESSQKRGAPITEKRVNPQTEAGQGARTRENVKNINEADLANRYSQAFRTRESLIEKYGKTGDPKDKQAALNAQAALDPIISEYIKVFGKEPSGYKPEVSLPKTVGRTEGQMRQEPKGPFPTAAQTQSREVARSAGRAGLVAPSITPGATGITGPTGPAALSSDTAAIIKSLTDQGLTPSTAALIASMGNGNTTGKTGGTSVSIQKNVQKFGADDIEALFRQVAPAVLGRLLDQKQIDELGVQLNAEARKNPSVTKTVTKSGGKTSVSTTQSEAGFNEQAYAQKTLQDTAEGQAFAADKVFRGAMQVLADRIG
jgi:hypothetical protein